MLWQCNASTVAVRRFKETKIAVNRNGIKIIMVYMLASQSTNTTKFDIKTFIAFVGVKIVMYIFIYHFCKAWLDLYKSQSRI